MKRKVLLIIGLIALSATILVGFSYLFVLSGAIFMFNSTPPAPEIKYGEFPISITYELNGETKIIEDTIICEFDGFENMGSAGKYRKWKSRLKSKNERLVLLREEGDMTFEITTSYGQPDYYMGDLRYESKEEYEKKMSDIRYFGYYQWKEGEEMESSLITLDEAWEKYRLKILNIQYSQPIQNSFK